MLTVKTVYDFVDCFAPFATQLDFDNAGLLTGGMDREVHRILTALDCTPEVVAEAEQLGCDLILTHHPLMFSPRKRMTEDDPEGRLLCRLIRDEIALIAAHTNLDAAPGGINDVLAGVCGLTSVTGEGFVRAGELSQAMPAAELTEALSERLHTVVRRMGDGTRLVRRLGVSSGAGSDGWEEALKMGCDGFLTGEMKHHHALAAVQEGLVCFECGHAATEAPGIFALGEALQKHLCGLQYEVTVLRSRLPSYRAD